jgi:hypothetical protein
LDWGQRGADGAVVIEAFNENGVILRSEWATLQQHLNERFGWATWP